MSVSRWRAFQVEGTSPWVRWELGENEPLQKAKTEVVVWSVVSEATRGTERAET